jgi:anti-anti-sigma factor
MPSFAISTATTNDLEIERHDEGGLVPVIVVSGDLDAAAAGDFSAAVGAVIALEHPERLVVDLSAVPFIDSTGLNEIVRANRVLRQHGGRLVLRSPGPTTRALLDITRMAGHLEIE